MFIFLSIVEAQTTTKDALLSACESALNPTLSPTMSDSYLTLMAFPKVTGLIRVYELGQNVSDELDFIFDSWTTSNEDQPWLSNEDQPWLSNIFWNETKESVRVLVDELKTSDDSHSSKQFMYSSNDSSLVYTLIVSTKRTSDVSVEFGYFISVSKAYILKNNLNDTARAIIREKMQHEQYIWFLRNKETKVNMISPLKLFGETNKSVYDMAPPKHSSYESSSRSINDLHESIRRAIRISSARNTNTLVSSHKRGPPGPQFQVISKLTSTVQTVVTNTGGNLTVFDIFGNNYDKNNMWMIEHEFIRYPSPSGVVAKTYFGIYKDISSNVYKILYIDTYQSGFVTFLAQPGVTVTGTPTSLLFTLPLATTVTSLNMDVQPIYGPYPWVYYFQDVATVFFQRATDLFPMTVYSTVLKSNFLGPQLGPLGPNVCGSQSRAIWSDLHCHLSIYPPVPMTQYSGYGWTSEYCNGWTSINLPDTIPPPTISLSIV